MYQTLTAHRDLDPLIEATIRLAAEQGTSALSSRSLAGAAGVSTSSINYRFQSLDGLIAAATSQAEKDLSGDWQDRAVWLEGLSPDRAEFGALVFTLIQSAARNRRGELRLVWNGRLEDIRKCRLPVSEELHAAELAVWERLLKLSRIDTLSPGTLLAFSQSLTLAYLAFDEPEDFDPWALMLVQRFSARLLKAPLDGADSSVRRAAEANAASIPSGPKSQHETATRILKTTISLILAEGADAVTHRRIAAEADLSVSSVQHFFGTREAILVAAYRAIYSSGRNRAVPREPSAGAFDVAELMDFLRSGVNEHPLESRGEIAAMMGLVLSASDRSASRAIAHGLLAQRGQTSMSLLTALRDVRGPLSRLDGQIFSLVLSQAELLPVRDPDAKAAVDPLDVGADLIRALFV